jgi:DNA-binding NarL/FixJ family response regulator
VSEEGDVEIRVVIVDDEQLVRSGLRLILEAEPDIVVVGEAGDGAEAVSLVERLDPNVVLMDIQMPGVNGIEATRRICALGREESSRVLMLTTFDIDEYVYESLHAGASGFLLKRTPATELVAGIRVIAAGDALLAPSITRRLLDTFASKRPVSPADTKALSELTDREREVLGYVARGLSNTEIAGTLFLSEGTVKTHIKRIFAKLGVRDRAQAVVFAYEAGLVEPQRD